MKNFLAIILFLLMPNLMAQSTSKYTSKWQQVMTSEDQQIIYDVDLNSISEKYPRFMVITRTTFVKPVLTKDNKPVTQVHMLHEGHCLTGQIVIRRDITYNGTDVVFTDYFSKDDTMKEPAKGSMQWIIMQKICYRGISV